METAQRNKPSPRPSSRQNRGNGHAQHAATPATGVRLEAAMSLCEAGHAIFAYHLNALLANEAGTRNDEDREALHQMRVATRRLSAALRDFRAAFSDEELDPFVRDVRWLGKLLGQIRDLDVLIEWLRSVEQDMPPETRPYVDRIVEDRELARVRERAALLTALDSPRYHNFVQSFSRFVQSDAGNAHCDQHALVELAIAKIESELVRVHKRGKRADLNHLKRLHQLRIEGKRLRYTSEFFTSLFPGGLGKLVKRAQAIQDDLGRVHDATVHRAFLKELRKTQSGDSGMRQVVTELMDLLARERKDAYRRFQKHYKRIGTKKALKKQCRRLEQAANQ